ncbi:MAG: aspartate ammonia-lyase, partial [Planctomycetes bacterium]|nr:aspartate ammonia-lyase [Planctomycetota bacterium]
TVSQEFNGWANLIDRDVERLYIVLPGLLDLAIGGTAVGTGLNTHPDFAKGVCQRLSDGFEISFKEADNHFAAQSNLTAPVAAAGALKGVALTLGKIAGDLRLLASGPRCGLGELNLPAVQPGSSIMPGKVNPVICESVIQVACQVIGYEAAIVAAATGGVGGILELNVAMPTIAVNLLDSIELLAGATEVFREKCIEGLSANVERCGELVERSLAMCTPLASVIGYDAAVEIAKRAYETGKTIRQVATEANVLPAEQLETLLNPLLQTGR